MPRNKYPEETVQKILDASLKLFIDKGYENTTVLDIVDNLGGLTRGAFYHHFKSKDEVMDALTERMFRENSPFKKLKKDSSLNGLQKLQKIMQGTTEVSDYRKISGEAVYMLKNPRFLAEFIESNRDILVPAYQELIEEGIKDGSISTAYPKQAAEVLTFLTNFWMIPTIFPFSAEEGIARLRMVKEITDSMGLPILEQKLLMELEDLLKIESDETAL